MRTRLSTYRWRPAHEPRPQRRRPAARGGGPNQRGLTIRAGIKSDLGTAVGPRARAPLGSGPRPAALPVPPARPPRAGASEFPAWPLPGRAAAKLQAFLERFPVSSLEHLYIFFRRISAGLTISFHFTRVVPRDARRSRARRRVSTKSRLLSARRYARSLRFSIPALYCPPLPST